MPPLRRAVALLVLLLYVTLGTVGVRMVLCNGQGGHTAIEWLGAGCCATPVDVVAESACGDHAGDHGCPESHATSHDTDDPPSDEDCGDCEDVSVARLIASPRVDLDSAGDPVPAAILVETLDARRGLFARGPPSAVAPESGEPPPVPDPLRSRTVLRL